MLVLGIDPPATTLGWHILQAVERKLAIRAARIQPLSPDMASMRARHYNSKRRSYTGEALGTHPLPNLDGKYISAELTGYAVQKLK